MQDFDTFPERDEYLSRLGVVLALARRASKMSQTTAAGRMQMSTAAFTRWEAGTNAISGFDLARLVSLYGFDPDMALDPPASRVEIKKRLGPVAEAARRAARRGLLRPVDDEDAGVDGEPG